MTYNAEQKPLVISFPTGEVGTTSSAAIAQHATTFTVASATNIAINQNLTIDSPPNVEQVQVASVPGTSVTIGSRGSGFRHPHSSGVAVVSQTGDTDTYAYNPSNGGMNSFTLDSDESGGYLGGTIGYNANGTIATVALTDTFNTGGNQTCDYLYDDLSRLASDLCGTGSLSYRSTMTYDSYDNITKSSSNGTGPTWPISGTYSATNNQLSSSTYDGNGSVLTDYFHTYSWDGFNKMLTIDSNTMTYDAFGRVVELAVSGTYTQHWYTPVGTKVLMNGSTIVKAHLPMPGGLTADWTPSGTYVNHKDWVGSSRLSTQAGAVYTDQALGPTEKVPRKSTGPPENSTTRA